MVVPVVNVPGLVHHSSQPIGLKNCFEPRQSKKKPRNESCSGTCTCTCSRKWSLALTTVRT